MKRKNLQFILNFKVLLLKRMGLIVALRLATDGTVYVKHNPGNLKSALMTVKKLSEKKSPQL